jgi:hypothetical protein
MVIKKQKSFLEVLLGNFNLFELAKHYSNSRDSSKQAQDPSSSTTSSFALKTLCKRITKSKEYADIGTKRFLKLK